MHDPLSSRQKLRKIRLKARRACAVVWEEGWVALCRLDTIEPASGRSFRTHRGPVALFRTCRDDIIAVRDHIPGEHLLLSDGVLVGRTVQLPSAALALDGPAVQRYEALLDGGQVLVRLS